MKSFLKNVGVEVEEEPNGRVTLLLSGPASLAMWVLSLAGLGWVLSMILEVFS